MNQERIFTDVYLRNRWGGRESVSGTGSDLSQTTRIVEELPMLLRDLQASSLLDIPCGDFNWMKTLHLGQVDYIGADIVRDLVERNQMLYGKDGVAFLRLDILRDELPKVDVILCRDCLVHLSLSDALKALHTICRSQSEYLATTTFPARARNRDILTGEWRPLNLELPPFNLPDPLRHICENCTEGNGVFADKSLSVWRIQDVAASLRRCQPGAS